MQQGVATAVRASSSVPGVIEPVEINGRLLGDGGVSNNLPVDVVREMGADYVIAVDLNSDIIDMGSTNGITPVDSLYILSQLVFIDNTLNREHIPFTIQFLNSGSKIIVNPVNPLRKGHNYTVKIDSLFDRTQNYLLDSITFFTEKIKPEPSNHVFDFSVLDLAYNSFKIGWELIGAK